MLGGGREILPPNVPTRNEIASWAKLALALEQRIGPPSRQLFVAAWRRGRMR